VKQVFYTYNEKPYNLWVYGNEQAVFAKRRPFGVTGRLVVSWFIQLTIIGLIFYWIANKNPRETVDSQAPLNVTAAAPTQIRADSFDKNLEAAKTQDAKGAAQPGRDQNSVYLPSSVVNDLVKLTQARVTENNILTYVRQHPASNQVSGDELLYLASNGVAQSVIAEYVRYASKQTQKAR